MIACFCFRLFPGCCEVGDFQGEKNCPTVSDTLMRSDGASALLLELGVKDLPSMRSGTTAVLTMNEVRAMNEVRDYSFVNHG